MKKKILLNFACKDWQAGFSRLTLNPEIFPHKLIKGLGVLHWTSSSGFKINFYSGAIGWMPAIGKASVLLTADENP